MKYNYDRDHTFSASFHFIGAVATKTPENMIGYSNVWSVEDIAECVMCGLFLRLRQWRFILRFQNYGAQHLQYSIYLCNEFKVKT